ncbi:hypothetical protein CRE_05216 [Caenorhabditis remanei]|uniref:Uncharacterized protein n=1 Tax=Caenorhabditis remanei TaxID=31234 RepID=E3NEB2_CAERE|nr:hypothetical protein CRE_05216 [Caenorhabditis remanei]
MGLLDLRTFKMLSVNLINVDKRESMTSGCYNANNDILYASIYLESNNETISSGNSRQKKPANNYKFAYGEFVIQSIYLDRIQTLLIASIISA